MVKIWEVDFCNFSGGTSDSAYDNVGDQDLLVHTANWTNYTPAPEFNFRNGRGMGAGGATQYYDLLAGGNTRAGWNSSYSPTGKRSFVLWFYSRGLVPEDGCNLWGDSENGADTIPKHGIISGIGSTYDEDLDLIYDNGNKYIKLITDCFLSTGWHNIVITVDRNAGQIRAYTDGSLVGSSNLFGDLPSTTRAKSRIGDYDGTREGSYVLGYTATYDHILTQPEVTEIYDTFLRDSVAGEVPLHIISGTVYDLENQAVSGGTVYLLRESSNYVEFYTETDGSGYYEVPIAYVGDYTLVATSVPDIGSRSQPLVATISGVTFL